MSMNIELELRRIAAALEQHVKYMKYLTEVVHAVLKYADEQQAKQDIGLADMMDLFAKKKT
jgi:hypothetical protein